MEVAHPRAASLRDVVHCERRLYLVFEYLDLDMKKHFDSNPEIAKDRQVIKARPPRRRWWGGSDGGAAA